MKTSKTKLTTFGLTALMALAMSTYAFAGKGTPSELQYITLDQDGGYTLDKVSITWVRKRSGKKYDHTYQKNMINGDLGCYDLSRIKSDSGTPILEGDEVWLVADISAGETKSSRKSKKHYYKKNNQAWHLIMKGSTLNGNRIENNKEPVGRRCNAGKGNAKFWFDEESKTYIQPSEL